jgi:hypothetical protein
VRLPCTPNRARVRSMANRDRCSRRKAATTDNESLLAFKKWKERGEHKGMYLHPVWVSCRWAQPAAFIVAFSGEGSLIESQLSEPLTCFSRPSQDADVTCTRRGSLEMRQVKVNWNWIRLSPPTPVQYSTLKYSVLQTNERPASSMHGSNEGIPSKRTPTLKRASLLRW